MLNITPSTTAVTLLHKTTEINRIEYFEMANIYPLVYISIYTLPEKVSSKNRSIQLSEEQYFCLLIYSCPRG